MASLIQSPIAPESFDDLVDGSEIRQSPFAMVSKPIIYRVSYIQTVVGNGISEASAISLGSKL